VIFELSEEYKFIGTKTPTSDTKSGHYEKYCLWE